MDIDVSLQWSCDMKSLGKFLQFILKCIFFLICRRETNMDFFPYNMQYTLYFLETHTEELNWIE